MILIRGLRVRLVRRQIFCRRTQKTSADISVGECEQTLQRRVVSVDIDGPKEILVCLIYRPVPVNRRLIDPGVMI